MDAAVTAAPREVLLPLEDELEEELPLTLLLLLFDFASDCFLSTFITVLPVFSTTSEDEAANLT